MTGEMLEKCGWCGADLNGQGIQRYETHGLVTNIDDIEVETDGYFVAEFCCEGCAWCFGLDIHKIWGMSGKEAREHLVKVHGLVAGKPNGKQSLECWSRSARIAKAVYRFMTGQEPESDSDN